MIDDKRSGIVYNAELKKPIPNVQLTFSNNNKDVKTISTDINGKWELNREFIFDTVVVIKEGYGMKQYISSVPSEIRLLKNNLIGYCSSISIKPNEGVKLYVHSTSDYSVKLIRYGFKKEEVFDFGLFSKSIQEVPDNNFVESGLEWECSTKLRIPDYINGGLYSITLENSDHEKFAIPIVINSSFKIEKSKILILASTNNWQCYNLWGGRSRYRNYEDYLYPNKSKLSIKNKLLTVVSSLIPFSIKKSLFYRIKKDEIGKDWMFKPLSHLRPHTNCDLDGEDVYAPFTNHLAGGEWRVLAWFEREGINYDFISGYELHSNPEILKNYRCIVLSTHCEYWSKKMYNSVNKYHNESKLSILNISGNSIYREVDFLNKGSIKCKSLHFKNSVDDETQLIGVRFDSLGYATCNKYKILKPDHWIFNGTANKSYLGSRSLNVHTRQINNTWYDPGRPGGGSKLEGQGASGWETDKISDTAPKDFVLLAKGMNKGSIGGADMIYRDSTEHRGSVFSASSITFGGALLIDNDCSLVIRNVLNKILSD